jgi:hypothetical protein
VPAKTVPPATGNKKAGPAKPAQSKKKKAAGGGKAKKGGKKKGKLKCGDSGKYGDLKKKYADGKESDHVPSGASLVKNGQELMKPKQLCDAQKAAIKKAASACTIPKGVHAAYSLTFRGLNNKKLIAHDAKNKKAAANRDTAAIKKGLQKEGASKECKKKYAAWAAEVNKRNKSWYESMIKTAVNK